MDLSWVLVAVGVALAVGVLIGWRIARKKIAGTGGDHPPPPPPPIVPDRLPPAQVADQLRTRIGAAAGAGPTAKVVWVDGGDEVLVHLDSLQARAVDGALLVSLDLETDQTGRQALAVVVALGTGEDGAGLVAMTEDVPRGDPALAARWGAAVQSAVWAALTELARAHADERERAPRALVATTEGLRLVAGDPLRVVPAEGQT